MITERKQYELFGYKIFEQLSITPPFKAKISMPDEACLYYIIDGEYKTVLSTEKARIVSNEALLMKCGNYLTEMLDYSRPKSHEAIAIHLHPEVLKKIYTDGLPQFLQNEENSLNKKNIGKIQSSIILRKYIEGLLFYFENPEIVTEEMLVLKLKELILLLSQTNNAAAIRSVLSSLFSPRSYSFKQIVEAHIFTNISLVELAHLANLSLSSFKREFKRCFNESPALHIKNKRLKRACNLLQIGENRITDIADECGFNSLPHFSSAFKKEYKLAPKEYQMSLKRK